MVIAPVLVLCLRLSTEVMSKSTLPVTLPFS